MKKSSVAILVIGLIIIFGVVFYLYHVDISKKQLDETLKNAEEIWKLNSKITELEEKLANQTDNQNITEENTQSKKNVKFDSSKMKSNSTMVAYEEVTTDLGSSGLEIEIKDGKPYLSTDTENEQYEFLFSTVKEPLKNKEITGFSTDVKSTYFAYMGNGDPAPIILFLMEDGSVEFVDSNKMLKNKQYRSKGKIKELSNIVKFVHLNAQELDENGEGMSGWITVAAIDEDGYSFDLSASETIQNNMLTSN